MKILIVVLLMLSSVSSYALSTSELEEILYNGSYTKQYSGKFPQGNIGRSCVVSLKVEGSDDQNITIKFKHGLFGESEYSFINGVKILRDLTLEDGTFSKFVSFEDERSSFDILLKVSRFSRDHKYFYSIGHLEVIDNDTAILSCEYMSAR